MHDEPRLIDTSQIALRPQIPPSTAVLARNVHDVWAR